MSKDENRASLDALRVRYGVKDVTNVLKSSSYDLYKAICTAAGVGVPVTKAQYDQIKRAAKKC